MTPSYLLNSILLLGLVQGFVISGLLFTTSNKPKLPNKLLAGLLFLLSLTCLTNYLREAGLYAAVWQIRWILDLLPTNLVMAFGPLIYLYTQAVLTPKYKITTHQKWYFLPVILDIIPALLCWVFFIGLLTQVLERKDLRGWGDIIDTYQTYMDIPRWLLLTFYLIAAKQFINQKHRAAFTAPENFEKQNLAWLDSFFRVFLGFQGVWFVFLLFYISPAYRDTLLATVSYYPILVPLAVLIYWLGLKGYLHAKAVGLSQASARPKISKILVPALTVENTITALRKAMEEDQLYLDPELNLDKIVTYLAIDQKTISHVLNQHLHQSFNTFVNGYRIDEVKQRLQENPNTHLTLTGIAFECGFNSQATFQRTFKQFTQLTPKAYLSAQKIPKPG